MLRSIMTPELLVFAMNVATESVAVCVLALWVTAVLRRSLPLQHSLLCATLGLIMVGPIILWVAHDTASGIIGVPFLSTQSPAITETPVTADVATAQDSQVAANVPTAPGGNRESGVRTSSVEEGHLAPSFGYVASSTADTSRPRGGMNSALDGTFYWLILIWCGISAVLMIRLGRCIHRLHRARRHLSETSDPRLIAAANHVEDAAGLSHRLRVCELPGIAAPVLLGTWRPVLVMPEGLASALNMSQLVSVMLHEAAHIVRRDPSVAVVQRLCQAMFWWNPAVYFVNREISRLRELICDDFAVSHCGDGTALGEAIVRTAEWSSAPRFTYALTPMLLDREDELEHRVVRLSQEERVLASAMGRREYSLLLVCVFLLLAETLVPVFRTQRVSAAMAQHRVDPGSGANSNQAPKLPSSHDPGIPGLQNAVDNAVAYLKQQQHPDGSWEEFPSQPGGVTALCTWALLRSEVPADDNSVQQALQYLRSLAAPERVYATAVRVMVFCAAEPQKDLARIRELARWLQEAQVTETTSNIRGYVGSWGYVKRTASGDVSNLQFAALALSESERLGVRVDPLVWKRLRVYLADSQNRDGSWGYKPDLPGTGSMTCAALASLAMAAKDCEDRETQDKCREAVDAGAKWLENNFTAQGNPNDGSWYFCYLDTLARAAIATDTTAFGEHNWYREGGEELLRRQNAVDGCWVGTGSVETNALIASSFALLFLENRRNR